MIGKAHKNQNIIVEVDKMTTPALCIYFVYTFLH